MLWLTAEGTDSTRSMVNHPHVWNVWIATCLYPMSHYAAAALLSIQQGPYKPDALCARVLQALENSKQEPQTVQVSAGTACPPAGPAPSAPPCVAVLSFHIPQKALSSLGQYSHGRQRTSSTVLFLHKDCHKAAQPGVPEALISPFPTQPLN